MDCLFKIFHYTNGMKKEIKIASNKHIKYEKNIAAILSFDLYQTDVLFTEIKKYSSYIEVINISNNQSSFKGRVLSVSKSMDSTGQIKATVQVESELNYLNDILCLEQMEFHPTDALPDKAMEDSKLNQTVKTFLEYILTYYNSRATSDKQILLGNIEDETPVYIKITEQVSILNLIQSKIVARHDGYLQIRMENNIRYLDFLVTSPVKEVLNIDLGVNQKSISIDDNFNFYTRIIPFGKDNIDITSVNNGINYIQDDALVKEYGVIEKIMKWEDVTIPQNLFNKANKAYKAICLGMDNIKLQGLDLSYLNNNFAALELYRPVRAINNLLAYDTTHEIVSIDINLDNPFESTFDLNVNEVSANNNVNSVIEMANKNTIEIVSIGNELITKVSGDEFETYREQSDKKIQETVKSIDGNIETIKTQLSDEISQKVSSDDVDSMFTQKVNEFDFTIGENTPLSITKDGLECKFSDGSETEISKDGFYYRSGDSKFSYHCLYYHGSVMKVKSGQAATIPIPEIFKGKDYKIGYWLGNTFPENPGDLTCSQGVELTENIKDSHFTIKINLLMRNPSIESSPDFKGLANIVYTILA